MKIEAGKYYRMRNGQFIGPVERDAFSERPWVSLGLAWSDRGSHDPWHGPHQYDLISEVYVSDTPPADAPAPETKTLRDEFAMEALNGLTSHTGSFGETGNAYHLAARADEIADSMMEARKK